jgi:hypothetical protein
MSNLWLDFSLALLLLVSECLAFIPIPDNGILHSLVIRLQQLSWVISKKHESAEQSKDNRAGAHS